MKTKQQRIDWFNSLTEQEKEEFYNRRKTRKRKYQPNKYPEPIITSENRDIWEKKILIKNPWLIDYNHSYKQPESYEVVEDFTSPDNISWEDYQHLQSIKQEARQ